MTCFDRTQHTLDAPFVSYIHLSFFCTSEILIKDGCGRFVGWSLAKLEVGMLPQSKRRKQPEINGRIWAKYLGLFFLSQQRWNFFCSFCSLASDAILSKTLVAQLAFRRCSDDQASAIKPRQSHRRISAATGRRMAIRAQTGLARSDRFWSRSTGLDSINCFVLWSFF